MTQEQYDKLAKRTDLTKEQYAEAAKQAIDAAKCIAWSHNNIMFVDLNEVKRTVFYGKVVPLSCQYQKPFNLKGKISNNSDHNTKHLIELFHAVLGLRTETDELLMNYLEVVYHNKSIEEFRQNLLEEVGDVEWYLSKMYEQIYALTGKTKAEVQQMNIDKLQKRYPDKFSNESALTRDTANELSHFDPEENK